MSTRALLLAVIVGVMPVRGQSSGDASYERTTQRGIEFVYNLEFEKAGAEFDTMIAMRPGYPAGHFFRAMVDWWRILIDMDNESYDDQFFSALDRVIAMCDSMLEVNEDDVNAIFFKGGSIGFQGRLRFHRDDYLGAANAGRKALPLVQVASELDPGNADILLGTGIYNYYADVIPREYPFLKPLLIFIPPGDRAKGLEELRRASERGKYAAVEATYFLMQVYYFYERDYTRALDIARTLHSRFPNNMLFHRYVGRCYVSTGNWEMADQEFSEIVTRARDGQRGYRGSVEREAEYYLGMYAMMRHRHDEALRHLYRCDELSRALDRKETSGFMVMTNLKIGNIYDLQGKRDLAIMQYNKVVSWKEHMDSHELAERYLSKPYTE